MRARRELAVVIGAMLMTGAALAQEGVQQQPPTAQPGNGRPRLYTIAVTVQSSDPRVKGITPQLNAQAAATVEKGSENVRAIIVTGTKRETEEQAQRRNADYLLTIEFSPQSDASIDIGPGARQPRDSEIYGAPRANAQGRMFLAWTVQPFNDNKVKLHDSRYVQPAEYPLAGNTPTGGVIGWDWVANIASRSVRDAAIAAMSKLKLKKGLGLELTIKGEHGN